LETNPNVVTIVLIARVLRALSMDETTNKWQSINAMNERGRTKCYVNVPPTDGLCLVAWQRTGACQIVLCKVMSDQVKILIITIAVLIVYQAGPAQMVISAGIIQSVVDQRCEARHDLRRPIYYDIERTLS
jgi:hypothetical protein